MAADRDPNRARIDEFVGGERVSREVRSTLSELFTIEENFTRQPSHRLLERTKELLSHRSPFVQVKAAAVILGIAFPSGGDDDGP